MDRRERLASSGVRVLDIINLSSSANTLLRHRVLSMRARGFDNRIMCMPGPYVKTLNEQGAPTVAVGLPRDLKPFQMVSSVFEMAAYMRRERIEIVHTHCAMPGLLGRIAAFLAGVPTIVHTMHGFDLAGSPRGSLLTRLYNLTEKACGRVTRMMLSQNRADVETIRELKLVPPDRLRFIGNGINLQQFRPMARTKTPSAEIMILCTARFEPVKNHTMLFDAIRKVKQSGKRIRLRLVGAGHLREDYERRCAELGIADVVEFLGYRDDMPELLAQTDISVLTSIDEGIPRAMLEAMAMRVPTVATNVVGTKETVVDGTTGFLVPLNDVDALADRLIRLIDDPALRERMGEAGRSRVEAEFDEDKIVDALAGIYRELLAAPNRVPDASVTSIAES